MKSTPRLLLLDGEEIWGGEVNFDVRSFAAANDTPSFAVKLQRMGHPTVILRGLFRQQLSDTLRTSDGMLDCEGSVADVETVAERVEIDPVCGMKVRPEKAAGSMVHGGKTMVLLREGMRGRSLGLRSGEV